MFTRFKEKIKEDGTIYSKKYRNLNKVKYDEDSNFS